MSVLSQQAASGVDGILEAAAREGRTSLYEHEVYGVLSCLGLSVPKFLFVRDPRQLGEAQLRDIGHTLVVKIVSPDVPHKQKLGGVRVVSGTDPLYVQYVLARMRDEVESHFPDRPPCVAGFLVVEFVPHTQALGYEVLIGFREDPAFGPALTVSKGGDDAEFFAANYDPANLFLPPMEYDEALLAHAVPAHPAQVRADRAPGVPGDDGPGDGGVQRARPGLFSHGGEAALGVQGAGGEPVRHLHGRPVRGPGRPGRVRPGALRGGVEPPGEPRATWTRSSAPAAWRWSGSRRTAPSTAWRATSRSSCTSCTARTCTW